MADIQTLLNNISKAVFGKDVRQSIHDAIQQCYYDGKAGAIDLEARQLLETKADKTDISTPYNFKGSVTFAELPASGNSVNDTYYVTDQKCKYTWDGAAWYQSSMNESDYQEELSQLSSEIDILNNGGLLLKEDFIGEQVQEWLDEHPEATTTVQDGSLLEQKIHPVFLPFIKNDYVTPQMYGAVGDGVTDDTTAIISCIEENTKVNLMGKTYLCKSDIFISNKSNLSIVNGVIIFDIAKTPSSNQGALTFDYCNNINITDLTIDCSKYCERPFYGESGYDDYLALREKTYPALKFSNCSDVRIQNYIGQHSLCAVYVTNSENVVIDNSKAFETMADGFFITGTSKNCHIANSLNVSGNDDAFTIIGFNTDITKNPINCSISNCKSYNAFGSALTILSASYCSASNITGYNNKYSPVKLGAGEVNGIYTSHSESINVSNVVVLLNPYFMTLTETDGYLIDGISENFNQKITLSNVTISFSGSSRKLVCRYTNHLTITNCSIGISIDFRYINNLIFSKNDVSTNLQGYIENCTNCIMTDNRLTTNLTSVFLVSGSTNFKCYNNISSQNILSLYGLNGLMSNDENILVGASNTNLIFTHFKILNDNSIRQLGKGSFGSYNGTFGFIGHDGTFKPLE